VGKPKVPKLPKSKGRKQVEKLGAAGFEVKTGRQLRKEAKDAADPKRDRVSGKKPRKLNPLKPPHGWK
jgi:hypothetical protein